MINAKLNLSPDVPYLETLSEIYMLSEHIRELEKSHPKAEILDKLRPIREQLRTSTFFERIQDWPRGYAGDFETIEYIMKCQIASKKGDFRYNIEKWALTDCGITQQHRNKVNYQSRLILETILNREGAEIASLGCGSCPDIRDIKKFIIGRSFHFDLIDIDADAIAYSKSKLNDIANQCDFIQGNIYRLCKKMTKKYDLIVIGGVFDYLNDKAIIEIIKKLYFDNLTPGGKLFYTNLSDNDHYRIVREYFGDWPLIQRSEEDMKMLIQAAGIPLDKSTLFKESTQLTYLAELVY